MKSDSFGMLLAPVRVLIPDRLIITPVDNFKDIVEAYKAVAENGFIHPPICQRVIYNSKNEKIREGVKKQADIYGLPSTHTIEYSDAESKDEFRSGTGRFILGMFNVLYDSRLQWEGWGHEDRIPANTDPVSVIYNGGMINFGGKSIVQVDQLSAFFISALNTWDSLAPEARKRLLNALYYHQKATAYKWGFEKFTVDYYAVDAIWRYSVESGLWNDSNAGHGKRITWMAHILGLYPKPDPAQKKNHPEIQHICDIRNNLFHEADWGIGNPIDVGFENGVCFTLHRLVKRLIVASVGVQNQFTESS